jgi:major membrane immunogen (membrane-anchored lipoprotein)
MDMKIWVLLSAALLIVGCSEPVDSDAQSNADEYNNEYDEYDNEYSDEYAEEGVFDPMISTMDRAAGVEDLSMSRKEEMDNAIEGN